jgi:hypothetical protein
MRRLAVGLFAAVCVTVFACQNTGGPGTPANSAPAPYGQPAQPYGAPAGYAQVPGQAPPPAPAATSPVPGTPGVPAPAGAGAMATPGPAAFPCANDSACGLAHCNTQYGKCAFPCADANVDCIAGSTCLAGFCVPKPPGS